MISYHANVVRSRILLVEDDDDTREGLRDYLADEGYTIAEARNGQEALDWLHQNALPDVIILDVMMPVMNGIEFRRAQMNDPALAHIPVIVVSAASQHNLSADHYLRKPFDLQLLLKAIQSHCQ